MGDIVLLETHRVHNPPPKDRELRDDGFVETEKRENETEWRLRQKRNEKQKELSCCLQVPILWVGCAGHGRDQVA